MGNTVLIADDADITRAMLRDILQETDLEVVGEARDGRQAIELFRQLGPSLVLLDLNMPEMDGIEALSRILAADPTARVVMITPLGQKEKVLASIKIGAKDFIVKPFDQERVKTTLARLQEEIPVPV